MTTEQKRRPEPRPQSTAILDTNKRPKNSNASSSPMTESKIKEKGNEYLSLVQERPNGGADHEVRTSPPPPPPHSLRSRQSTPYQTMHTRPRTIIDTSNCFLSDGVESALARGAGAEGLMYQSVVIDSSSGSQKTLTDIEACHLMEQLADYFEDPGAKSSEVWDCFGNFLRRLLRAPS